MNKVKPRTLSGFMELLPRYQVYFNAMIRRLQDSFSLYGFTPLDTPLMEASEVLLAKGGGETEKQIYRLNRGDTDLALRYELTTSLAKYVTMYYNDITFPFRRYEIGKVYRGERAQRGRFREFYQADIDIIGDNSLSILNEAEIPSVIYHSLKSLGVEGFVIHINNRKILNGLFEILGITDKEASVNIMRIIDKTGKIGADTAEKLLIEETALSPSAAKQLTAFITAGLSDGINQNDADNILKSLEEYKDRNKLFDEGVNELSLLRRYLNSFGVPDSHYKLDLSVARGLDYYTGTVFETFLTAYPEVGSICSGGRYDDLATYFTDRKMPGVGISIGLTRLFYILQEQKLLSEAYNTAPADVLVIPMTDDLTYAVRLASTMREAQLRVMIFSENKKIKQKVSYADKLSIPFVVFIGEDEIERDVITVKDMAGGVQTTASAGILIAGICDKINKTQCRIINV